MKQTKLAKMIYFIKENGIPIIVFLATMLICWGFFSVNLMRNTIQMKTLQEVTEMNRVLQLYFNK